ncbi:pseudouridine synthase [Breznakiella homolactica]|uniref:RNA pseudouridine synthase n=1 Tax=Breznakiella homolactica TaxID=2798577 RepID=A0A7T7XKE2_9SPIR|nr:pseudouridine synthase [Breznakiella homolactica]QQO08040.1 RNA pseudouridine synthase [Breznakiella homolactica]
MDEPHLVAADEHFIAVYKPPGMHTVPLRPNEPGTLLEWCSGFFPEILMVRGRKPVEGGTVHRLDRDTRGLVLFARSQQALDDFIRQQEAGLFVKEYSAVSGETQKNGGLPGFPARPLLPDRTPFFLRSAFRAYGPGRKSVRPILPGPGDTASWPVYETEVLEQETRGHSYFTLRISRGFRHQVRCHLAWIGFPLLNDSVYGGESGGRGSLALKAMGLVFNDPVSGEKREIRIPGISLSELS